MLLTRGWPRPLSKHVFNFVMWSGRRASPDFKQPHILKIRSIFDFIITIINLHYENKNSLLINNRIIWCDLITLRDRQTDVFIGLMNIALIKQKYNDEGDTFKSYQAAIM